MDATQQLSNIAQPSDSSAIHHDASVIVSIVSISISLSQFNTDDNDEGFTDDDIAAVAPPTVGVDSSHVKGSTPTTDICKVIGVESDIVIPFNPPGIVATTSHRHFTIVLHHLPIIISHTDHDVDRVREGHVAVAATRAAEVTMDDDRLLAYKSSRLIIVTLNDDVPDEVGAIPFDRGSDAPRALSRAVFMHTAFKPVPIQSGQVDEPTTAAREVPRAYATSTPGCEVGNEGDSVEVHIIVISRPERHVISGAASTAVPAAVPGGTPPGGSAAGYVISSPASGAPLATTTVTG